MRSYTMRDIRGVLALSPATVRGLIRTGLVQPARGARREYRFSFQDLIVLRTARALMQAQVPPRRIRRSLSALRRSLPAALPLSGLAICAVGDRVVVRDGRDRWQAETGQYLLGLDVSVQDGTLRITPREAPVPLDPARRRSRRGHRPASPPRAPEPHDAAEWLDRALETEFRDPAGALEAYARACALDPACAAAWINRGRLLHEKGRLEEAGHVYGEALRSCAGTALLHFNFGVLLEDTGRTRDALGQYRLAIAADARLADAHFNIARLYELFGEARLAIRHLTEYRRLTGRRRP